MANLRPVARRGGLTGLTRVWLSVAMLVPAKLAWATDYTVKPDGSGNFATIQACANAVTAGNTCVVYPGTYDEFVRTASGGTSDTSRVIFRTQGTATMRGFEIRHPYVTVEGFDVTGYTSSFIGLITIYPGGGHCNILNNILRDGAANVQGIYFYLSSGQAASNCVVRGNVLTNLRYMFITTAGSNHLFESNRLEHQNNGDFVRLFGSNHVFRRNVFRYAGSTGSTGNHPDVAQTFGQPDMPSENHLFEENWIEDLESQFGQYNSGGITSGHELYTNYRNVVFRRNIIVNVSMNGNFSFPGIRFENNTFYRFAHTLSGLYFGGSLTRGDASGAVLKNNVFLEGGASPTTVNSSGYYSLSGASFSQEVIRTFVTSDPSQTNPATSGIYSDLQTQGYIDGNGKILAAARSLTDISQFVLGGAYSAYREATYARLSQTVQLDTSIRNTFAANYNYVGGAAAAGFPAKRNSGCVSLQTYVDWNFCEPNGVNGGDPGLRSVTNLLGPDGLPFTLDDGLKPTPSSRLCGAGQGGTDIGAYSCAVNEVFVGVPAGPQPPTNVRIIR